MTATFWLFYVGKMAIKPTFYGGEQLSNLEHLIENTLVAMEDHTLCNKDIRERIKNDVNLPYTSLSVDDV